MGFGFRVQGVRFRVQLQGYGLMFTVYFQRTKGKITASSQAPSESAAANAASKLPAPLSLSPLALTSPPRPSIRDAPARRQSLSLRPLRHASLPLWLVPTRAGGLRMEGAEPVSGNMGRLREQRHRDCGHLMERRTPPAGPLTRRCTSTDGRRGCQQEQGQVCSSCRVWQGGQWQLAMPGWRRWRLPAPGWS